MKRRDLLIGLMLALFVALFLSPFASHLPDGLERVAADHGFLNKGQGKELIRVPLPDYKVPGWKNEKLAASLSGALGVLMMFGIGYGVAILIKKGKRKNETRIP